MIYIVKTSPPPMPLQPRKTGADEDQATTTVSANGQKTAFLTGGSGGIGKAAALARARAGYRVIRTSRRVEPGEVRDGIRMIACDAGDDASGAGAIAKRDTAEDVAATILAAAQDGPPRLRFPSGEAARQTSFARHFLPGALFDRTPRKQFNIGGVRRRPTIRPDTGEGPS